MNPLETLVARRLDWLFKNVRKQDGTEYSHPEIEQLTERQGYKVTAAAIWNIRNGKTPNPGFLTLRALAQAFGVKPDAIFYEEELTEDDLTSIRDQALLHKPLVREIAARAGDLDEESQQAILDMIKFIAKRGKKSNEG